MQHEQTFEGCTSAIDQREDQEASILGREKGQKRDRALGGRGGRGRNRRVFHPNEGHGSKYTEANQTVRREAYFSRAPTLPVLLALSEPARSTKDSLPTLADSSSFS